MSVGWLNNKKLNVVDNGFNKTLKNYSAKNQSDNIEYLDFFGSINDFPTSTISDYYNSGEMESYNRLKAKSKPQLNMTNSNKTYRKPQLKK